MQYTSLDPWYKKLWARYGIHWFTWMETKWAPRPSYILRGYTRFSGPMWVSWLTAALQAWRPTFGTRWITRLLWSLVSESGACLEHRPSPFVYSWPEMKAALKSYAFAGLHGTYSLIELYAIPFVFDVNTITPSQRERLTWALIEQLSKNNLVLEQTIFGVQGWVPTVRGRMLMGIVNPLVSYEAENPYSYVPE